MKFARRSPGENAVIAIGIAACIALFWLAVGSSSSESDTTAELPPARPTAAPSPAPAAPLVTATPSDAATATFVANNGSAGFADSFKAALADTKADTPAETAAMIPVTVRVSPSDAFIFKSDRRLGRGSATINVAPGAKTTIVALRDGYTARTLVLDGKYNSVNITLKRAATSSSSHSKGR